RLPARVAQRIQFVAGTATDLDLVEDSQFDAVLFGLNAFSHLTSVEERHAALLQAHRHLRPNGQLLLDIDLLGPRRLLDAAGLLWWQGAWPVAGVNTAQLQLVHMIAGLPGREPGTIEVMHLYDAHAQAGVVTRTTARMSLALLTYGEIAATLARAGVILAAAYGGYDLASYEVTSPRLIVDAHSSA